MKEAFYLATPVRVHHTPRPGFKSAAPCRSRHGEGLTNPARVISQGLHPGRRHPGKDRRTAPSPPPTLVSETRSISKSSKM